MIGVSVLLDDTKNFIDMVLDPSMFERELDSKSLWKELNEGQYKTFYISQNTLKSACDKANHYFKTNDNTKVRERIGERRNTEVEFKISSDGLSAGVVFTAPYGGRLPTIAILHNMAEHAGICRGLSFKRLEQLLTELSNAAPGSIIEGEIARGLPPKDGRNSKFVPLVPNALERVLKPQVDDNDRVNMRNLGEVICVKVNAPVLRRTEPSQGRHGFDVKGNILTAKPGCWQEFKMGKGTAISEHDSNILVATISGMPKYRNQVMDVDDTFICSGVNVGSGHVSYDGAVLVNGDVTEKMEIKASGDVTINGFVESARIEAGGDIIVTEGAMGKVDDDGAGYSCQLTAKGSIHVQHGQGIDMQCSGNITVGRQLAYSRIQCGGSVTVGQVAKPMGNLFACEIISQGTISAGTLGAVSGSTLKIDFSPGFSKLLERKDELDELLRQLRDNNARHREKIESIKAKLLPSELNAKVEQAVEMYNGETDLLNWLELKVLEMRQKKDAYQNEIGLIANKRLYSGVSVKLNNRNWRSEREYDRSHIFYENHKWHFDPIV
ncbi:FapA family protein [Alteromonas lipotrueiana]|uniref:FapA family protein n=1 Tax=Alteromonas lipotrueiana TaxID=2803815 RepID=UPI001C497937|nr:FapA family protein [Alteromonas lipotrueiana]